MAKKRITRCINWPWEEVSGQWWVDPCSEGLSQPAREGDVWSYFCPECQESRRAEQWDQMDGEVYCCSVCHRPVWTYDLARPDEAEAQRKAKGGKFPPTFCRLCANLFAFRDGKPLGRHEWHPDVLEMVRAEERRRKRLERAKRALVERAKRLPPYIVRPLDEPRDKEGLSPRAIYEEHPEQVIADDIIAHRELDAVLKRLPPLVRNAISWWQHDIPLRKQAELSGKTESALSMLLKRNFPKIRKLLLDEVFDEGDIENEEASDEM